MIFIIPKIVCMTSWTDAVLQSFCLHLKLLHSFDKSRRPLERGRELQEFRIVIDAKRCEERMMASSILMMRKEALSHVLATIFSRFSKTLCNIFLYGCLL